MCGIAGWVSSKPLDVRTSNELSKALLWYAEERGHQSAGVYTPENGLLKRAMNPHKFIEGQEFEDYWKKPTKMALLHTRQPTCGDKTDVQAQPFSNSSVVTVHNGWYLNAGALKDRWGLTKTSGVDSELVTDFIESYSIKMLPDFIDSTHGSSAIGAIVDQKLYVYRDGNPLSFVSLLVNGDTKLTVFASTSEIITKALGYLWLLPELPIKNLHEHTLLELTPGGFKKIASNAKPKRQKRHSYPRELLFTGEPENFEDDPGMADFFRSLRIEDVN